jgi:hypothetical protein
MTSAIRFGRYSRDHENTNGNNGRERTIHPDPASARNVNDFNSLLERWRSLAKCVILTISRP